MVLEATVAVEDVTGTGDYQRLYAQKSLVSDSAWPFRPGQNVRMQLVETTCERTVLVVVPATLEVDTDASALEIQRSSDAPEQVTLEMEGSE